MINRLRDHRGDEGMTLIELMITSTILVVLLGMVMLSMNLIGSISSNITAQYQEFDQALPALAPFHKMLAAQIEPAPPVNSVPTPPFGLTTGAIGNFSMTFYANVGTSYNNTVACPQGQTCMNGGTTAGPAKVVASLLDAQGNQATSCSTKIPCNLQVRLYLPETGLNGTPGSPSCPIQWGTVTTTTACTYSDTKYTLLANVQGVVNDPSQTDGNGPTQAIFSYSLADPTYNQIFALTPQMVDTGTISGLSAMTSQNSTDTNYPTDTQSLTACDAPSYSYPTPAIACPADAVQSVGINLMVAEPGSSSTSTVQNSLVVYRYAQSPGSSTAPYQYSELLG
jgi:prepilin-type N-terminal cleavage/methylation domain-containing protein